VSSRNASTDALRCAAGPRGCRGRDTRKALASSHTVTTAASDSQVNASSVSVGVTVGPSFDGGGSQDHREGGGKGSGVNNFAIWSAETPDWQGARRAHSRSTQPTSNAARRDGSALQMVMLFAPEP